MSLAGEVDVLTEDDESRRRAFPMSPDNAGPVAMSIRRVATRCQDLTVWKPNAAWTARYRIILVAETAGRQTQ